MSTQSMFASFDQKWGSFKGEALYKLENYLRTGNVAFNFTRAEYSKFYT